MFSNWRWPGAILTFLCYVVLVNAVQLEAIDGEPVTIKLAERAPAPLRQPLAFPPPAHLRPREPKRKKKVETVTQMVTVTQTPTAAASNATAQAETATVLMTETVMNTMMATVTVTNTEMATATVTNMMMATQTVTNTMMATNTVTNMMMATQTLTNMMMMTVTAPQAAVTSNANAVSNPQMAAAPLGMANALDLGTLAKQSMAMPIANQVAQQIQEELVTAAGSTVFAIATETRTSFVSQGTGAGMTESKDSTMRSEAISGRQAGTRCIGFGAVVFAVAVAVVIL